MAEGNLHAVDTVDRGVAGWRATQGCHQRTGNEPHMHQVVLHGFRQIEGHQNPALADIQLAQHAQLPYSDRLPESQQPETTTGLVAIQYTIISVRAANTEF
jgi:hypothetical protein